MALVGYARVSTSEQSTRVQVAALKRFGVDAVFAEQKSSVKHRPVLEHVLKNVLQPGDTLVVYKLDRLARSMSHFVRIFERLQVMRVGFKSLTEVIDTTTAQGRMFLSMLGVFAEFERELIRERCIAGQVAARARGQTWGPVAHFTHSEALQVAAMWRWGVPQLVLAEMFGVSVSCLRDTIHRAEKRGRWS